MKARQSDVAKPIACTEPGIGARGTKNGVAGFFVLGGSQTTHWVGMG